MGRPKYDNYVCSLSCGKDSLAMLLRLIEEGRPLTLVIMYDTGMEFGAIYNILEKVKMLLEEKAIPLVVLKPQMPFLYDMLVRPVHQGTDKERYGYEWCGGMIRWGTSCKTEKINKYLNNLGGKTLQYIGIAADETERLKEEDGKYYPLAKWGMTEEECLQYCYDKGYNWLEDGIELYSILDRVSCWCCGNKNLKELRNIYFYLPKYWSMLCGLQSRIDKPFRRDGVPLSKLEKRFALETMGWTK